VEEIGQIIVELFLQLFLEVIADAIWRRLPEPARLGVKAVLSVGVAILLGWLSSLAFPKPFIAVELFRIAYLILVPVLLGFMMSLIGVYFSKRSKARSTLESFGFGWLFAFSFALTRYFATT
jgi:hypothetical protein